MDLYWKHFKREKWKAKMNCVAETPRSRYAAKQLPRGNPKCVLSGRPETDLERMRGLRELGSRAPFWDTIHV
jgi:hypothetical protein